MALTDAQLRARIRALIAAGDLSDEPPVIHAASAGSAIDPGSSFVASERSPIGWVLMMTRGSRRVSYAAAS